MTSTPVLTFNFTTSVPVKPAELDPCNNSVPGLYQFRDSYRVIHMYLCLILCPIGVIANILNVIVLNQRVLKSPTNFLLTVVAISDGLIMAFYIPFDVWYLIQKRMEHADYASAVYLLFYLNLQNILHAFSSWLIVGLALFRLLYIRFAAQSKTMCNMQRAKQMVIGVISFSFILTIPYAVTHIVVPVEKDNGASSNDTEISYTIDYVDDKVRQQVLFWSSAILLKLLPLILLTILSILLVLTLKDAERRRRNLRQNRRESAAPGTPGGGGQKSSKAAKKERTKSTTRSLLVIVIIFVIAYLPQAILIFLIYLMDTCGRIIYDCLGDFLDLLVLLNNGVNFILYCIMSRQFREVFTELFRRRKARVIRTLQVFSQVTHMGIAVANAKSNTANTASSTATGDSKRRKRLAHCHERNGVKYNPDPEDLELVELKENEEYGEEELEEECRPPIVYASLTHTTKVAMIVALDPDASKEL